MRATGWIARVAVFSALVYIVSWATGFLPNITLGFFVVFSAGYLWGSAAGVVTGAVGFGLWSAFNPYGPAPLPVMAAQALGGALVGLVGQAANRMHLGSRTGPWRVALLALIGAFCTLAFYLPVTLVDAWLFQPFEVRMATGLGWALWPLAANLLIFPLLFGATAALYARDRKQRA
jgi:uncharacterized membrane protein